MTPVVINKPLRVRALELAVLEIGKGEDPGLGNNRGADIDRFCMEAGVPWLIGEAPSWCCILVCAKFACAAGGPGHLPFKPLASAENCWKEMLYVPGAELVTEPAPGDLLLWKRRNRFGIVVGRHIAFAKVYRKQQRDLLVTVDGNRDKRRGKGKYALVDSFVHQQGEWRDDLVGILRLPG